VKLLLWLVKLYPRAWRERYEIEMVALLEEHNITFFTLIDLLFGALDARLDPHYRAQRTFLSGERMSRIRIANSAIFWVFPLFWLCWMAFLSELSDFIVNRFDPLAEITTDLFRIGFGITMLAVLLSGLFVSLVTARGANSTYNAVVRFIPLACFLFACISYFLAANNRPLNGLVFICTLFIGFLLTSIIMAKGNIGRRVHLLSFMLTILATVGMIVQLVMVTFWSSTLFRFHGTIMVVSISGKVIHSWSLGDRIVLLTAGLGSMTLLTLVTVFILLRGLLALISTRKVAPKEEVLQTMPPLVQWKE